MTTDRRSSPLAALVAAKAILLPAAYVLSTGPVIWLWHHGYIPEGALAVVYWPLEMLCRYCVPVREFFDAYLRLWGRP